MLPIEEVKLPEVSDLRDVFDAIDRLCDSMKATELAQELDSPPPPEVEAPQYVDCSSELIGPEEVAVCSVETWSEAKDDEMVLDAHAIMLEARRRGDDEEVEVEAAVSDPETGAAGEVGSEYYTASSEVSLLSLVSLGERGAAAGHVAAMRERYESMTRSADTTPEPDLG